MDINLLKKKANDLALAVRIYTTANTMVGRTIPLSSWQHNESITPKLKRLKTQNLVYLRNALKYLQDNRAKLDVIDILRDFLVKDLEEEVRLNSIGL